MQNTNKLRIILETFSDEHTFMFTANSLSSAFEELSEANINQLLSRASKSNLLERVCKGVYVNPKVKFDQSSVLFMAANTMRYGEYMYVSLETVLSSLSVISQQMTNYITIVTSGRSGIIDCSRFGKIEFIHSDKMEMNSENVKFDMQTGMFWATKEQALKDMKTHRRKLVSLLED